MGQRPDQFWGLPHFFLGNPLTALFTQLALQMGLLHGPRKYQAVTRLLLHGTQKEKVEERGQPLKLVPGTGAAGPWKEGQNPATLWQGPAHLYAWPVDSLVSRPAQKLPSCLIRRGLSTHSPANWVHLQQQGVPPLGEAPLRQI